MRERRVRQYIRGRTLVREKHERRLSYQELFLDVFVVANVAALSLDLRWSYEAGNAENAVVKTYLILGMIFAAWRNNAFRFNVLTALGADVFEILELWALLISFTGIGVSICSAFDSGRYLFGASAFAALSSPCFALIVGTWHGALSENAGQPFRNHAVFRSGYQLLCASPYLLLCFTGLNPAKINLLFTIGCWANITSDYVSELLYRFFLRNDPNARFSAVCIETWVERHTLMLMISFGENILTFLQANRGKFSRAVYNAVRRRLSPGSNMDFRLRTVSNSYLAWDFLFGFLSHWYAQNSFLNLSSHPPLLHSVSSSERAFW